MRKLKNILQHRYLFKVSAIVCLILVIIFTNIFRVDSKFDGTETSFVGVVYKIKYSSDKTILYIKGKLHLKYKRKVFRTIGYKLF